jgi:hypothetical protein
VENIEDILATLHVETRQGAVRSTAWLGLIGAARRGRGSQVDTSNAPSGSTSNGTRSFN